MARGDNTVANGAGCSEGAEIEGKWYYEIFHLLNSFGQVSKSLEEIETTPTWKVCVSCNLRLSNGYLRTYHLQPEITVRKSYGTSHSICKVLKTVATGSRKVLDVLYCFDFAVDAGQYTVPANMSTSVKTSLFPFHFLNVNIYCLPTFLNSTYHHCSRICCSVED